MWAWDSRDGDSAVGLVESVVGSLGFVVVLGPLSWLRHLRWGSHGKQFWIFLGLSVAWAAISLLAVLGLLALLGDD